MKYLALNISEMELFSKRTSVNFYPNAVGAGGARDAAAAPSRDFIVKIGKIGAKSKSCIPKNIRSPTIVFCSTEKKSFPTLYLF